MDKNKKTALRRLTEKVYGGLNMSWPTVILYAIGTAVLTAVFLLVPIFRDTSFERMGVNFEAWIFFAVIIMANCKKPLESALKTFVFFLISQPLIYLIQVPFSDMGWALMGYYRFWIVWTLLTLPMAYVGWYITKRSWLSLLILAPVLCFLSGISAGSFLHAFKHFPYLIVTALFCLAQVLIYLYRFTNDKWQKTVGLAVALLTAVVVLLAQQSVNVESTLFLPEGVALTENATVEVENDEKVSVSIEGTGEDSMLRVQASEYGTTGLVIRDGNNEYRYSLEIYEDEKGHSQLRITPENGR